MTEFISRWKLAGAFFIPNGKKCPNFPLLLLPKNIWVFSEIWGVCPECLKFKYTCCWLSARTHWLPYKGRQQSADIISCHSWTTQIAPCSVPTHAPLCLYLWHHFPALHCLANCVYLPSFQAYLKGLVKKENSALRKGKTCFLSKKLNKIPHNLNKHHTLENAGKYRGNHESVTLSLCKRNV